jgi:hypothetical protein
MAAVVSSYAAYLTGYFPQGDPSDWFVFAYVSVVSIWIVWALFYNGDRK